MNQFDIPGNDDLRFDRLVDGELSDAERRRLLASLDDEPGAGDVVRWLPWRHRLGERRCESFRNMVLPPVPTRGKNHPKVGCASPRSQRCIPVPARMDATRSEEHTSELQSRQ